MTYSNTLISFHHLACEICRGIYLSCTEEITENEFVFFGRGVGHDVMKILNFSAIQCKFYRCPKKFNYKQ